MRGRPKAPELSSTLDPDLFRRIYPGLRRFAAVVGDSDVEPDDLVQEAVAAYLARFEGTDGADRPEAYLRTAIAGVALNHRRAMGRRRRRHHEDPSPQVDWYPSDVRCLLATTTPEERVLLLLVDIEGESISAAARTLGISAVAARARLSRVRRRLRSTTGGHDGR